MGDVGHLPSMVSTFFHVLEIKYFLAGGGAIFCACLLEISPTVFNGAYSLGRGYRIAAFIALAIVMWHVAVLYHGHTPIV